MCVGGLEGGADLEMGSGGLFLCLLVGALSPLKHRGLHQGEGDRTCDGFIFECIYKT